MALTILSVPNTILLTTLDRAKAELGITDTDNDDILTDMICRASSAITKECGRPSFAVGTYQETLKGSGSQLLGLSCVPILSVTQVMQDTEVLDPTDPTDGYSIEDADAGALYRASGWGQSVSLLSWGWQAYSSRYILPGGTSTLRYTVTYTAGYFLPGQEIYALQAPITGMSALYDPTAGVTLDTAIPPTVPNIPPVLNVPSAAADAPPLPGAIEQACLVTVKSWWFSRQQDPDISAIRSAEQSLTYAQRISERSLPITALGFLRDYRRVA